MTTLAADEPFGDAWKALADPTRRAILDLLRDQPWTTGDLAGRFPDLSRLAVMKHLDVLAAARLVVVTRDRRERWNRLNPVHFQAIVRRWLDPFAADALLRLKRVAEYPPDPGAAPMPRPHPPSAATT